MEESDERNPRGHAQYRKVDPRQLPLTESLKDTIARVIPYFEQEIRPRIEAGERVVDCRAWEFPARTGQNDF